MFQQKKNRLNTQLGCVRAFFQLVPMQFDIKLVKDMTCDVNNDDAANELRLYTIKTVKQVHSTKLLYPFSLSLSISLYGLLSDSMNS